MGDVSISSDTTAAAQQFVRDLETSDEQKKGKFFVGVGTAAVAAAATVHAANLTNPTDSTASMHASAANSKAVVNADAPHLPTPTGKSGSPAEVIRIVASGFFTPGGATFYAAIESMTKAVNDNITNARLIKMIQGAVQVGAKQQDFNDKKTEISGERVSADTKFAVSTLGTFAGWKMSKLGTEMDTSGTAKAESEAGNATKALDKNVDAASLGEGEKTTLEIKKSSEKKFEKLENEAAGKTPSGADNPTDDSLREKMAKRDEKKEIATSDKGFAKTAATGAGLRTVAMSISGVFTSMGDVIDRSFGGQKQADMAGLAEKSDQITGQVAQNNVDSANSFLESSLDKWKTTQQAITTRVQMWADLGNKVG